jgi:hypothetical protein
MNNNNSFSNNSNSKKTTKISKILKKKIPKPTTNIISINFENLINKISISTGEPINCKFCKAILSSISNITNKEENLKLWICEFCGKENEIQCENEELPKEENIDYIIGTPLENRISNDETVVIFCIDISGSMCVSYEVEGKFSLKGSEKNSKTSRIKYRKK